MLIFVEKKKNFTVSNLSTKVVGQPWVEAGVMFFGSSDSHVYMLNASSGDIMWSRHYFSLSTYYGVTDLPPRAVPPQRPS